jgi:hypothetical protein
MKLHQTAKKIQLFKVIYLPCQPALSACLVSLPCQPALFVPATSSCFDYVDVLQTNMPRGTYFSLIPMLLTHQQQNQATLLAFCPWAA